MPSQARYCLSLSSIILFQVSATLMYSITIPCSIFSVSIIYLILAYIHIYPRKVFISKHNFSNHGQIIFFSKGGNWIRWKDFIPQCSKRRNRGGGGRGRRMSFRWGNSAKVLIFIRMITIFGSELEWLISNIIFQISVITPAKREHLLVGTCLLENIISRKHKKDIDEDRKKFRHQWVDICSIRAASVQQSKT